MNFQQGVFFVLAGVLVLSALRVITSRNPVHAALFLVLAFASASGLWMLLHAEFLAITLVLVYVGAVMVLFLFVIMLLDLKEEERRKFRTFTVGTGVIAVGVIACLLLQAVLKAVPYSAVPVALAEGLTQPLGRILFTQYLLPFELLSLLLLVAMVGAILLTKKELK